MGFDISFHSIDTALFASRLIPFLRGAEALDATIAAALHAQRNRFRANAWALGAMASKDAAIEPGLHVWGRPLLLTGTDAKSLAETFDRYVAASNEEDVDAIARGELDRLAPGLGSRVIPDAAGKLGPEPERRKAIARALELGREARLRFLLGARSIPLGAESLSPADILAKDVLFNLVRFASHLCPTWIDRGPAWPTRLFAAAGVAAGKHFESPRALLGELDRELGHAVRFEAPTTIEDNYTVGGYVRPENVPTLRAAAEDAAPALIRAAETLDLAPRAAHLLVQKQLEALRDAEHRSHGFLEATDIYSPLAGQMS